MVVKKKSTAKGKMAAKTKKVVKVKKVAKVAKVAKVKAKKAAQTRGDCTAKCPTGSCPKYCNKCSGHRPPHLCTTCGTWT